MTRNEFSDLNQSQKLEAIWNMGKFIATVHIGDYEHEVYSIDSFLVELVNDKKKENAFWIQVKDEIIEN